MCDIVYPRTFCNRKNLQTQSEIQMQVEPSQHTLVGHATIVEPNFYAGSLWKAAEAIFEYICSNYLQNRTSIHSVSLHGANKGVTELAGIVFKTNFNSCSILSICQNQADLKIEFRNTNFILDCLISKQFKCLISKQNRVTSLLILSSIQLSCKQINFGVPKIVHNLKWTRQLAMPELLHQ